LAYKFRGITVKRYVDDVIDPKNFQDFDDFFKVVETRFREAFFKLYRP
jgi:hypothetical protein